MTTTSAAANSGNTWNEAADGRVELQAGVVARASVAAMSIASMYSLYSRHYLDTTPAIFQRDLAAKTHVLLLRDERDRLCGFSTLEVYASAAAGRNVRVIYSGDTIIDPKYWGSSAFALAWLRFAGEVQRQDPCTPLHWLLIAKGHRTYRFLPAFARHYLPHHSRLPTDAERYLLNALAAEKFGAAYDPLTGIVRFAQPQGRLTADLAEVSDRHRRLPAVAYFLERNPGYGNGDELVCLCELVPANLRSVALRVFTPSAGSPLT
jgi:hypothetical protein